MDTFRWSHLLATMGFAACITGCANDPEVGQLPTGGSLTAGADTGVNPGVPTDTLPPGITPGGPGDPLPENQTPEGPLDCLAPKIMCEGQCINPASNGRFCGASANCAPPLQGQACAPGLVCSQGQCAAQCNPGQVVCNGGCIDPQTSLDHCGAMLDCVGTNAGQSCAPGQVCNAGTCTQSCGADELACNGECVNPSTDPRHCGATLDCVGPNAGQVCPPHQVCSGGLCKLECNAGTLECNGECINPLTDNRYCGALADCVGDANNGEVCPAGSICSGGECELQCDAGLVECEGSCIDPTTDNNFCGAQADCVGSTKCAVGQSCVDGLCQLECPAGKVKCNDKCIDPNTDNNHCGASADCLGPNAGSICSGDLTCVAGSCELRCDADEIECSGRCIDPKTDASFCGASGDCSGVNAGQSCDPSTHACIDGSCKPQCDPGLIACGDSCINPNTDMNYCGASEPCDEIHNGEACSANERCMAGVCTFYCAFPEINCGGTCINPSSNVSNCGAVGNCAGPNAGTACDANEACIDGRCELQCAADEIVCDDRCVNPNTDRDYCGANAACNGGQSCGDDFVCANGTCQRDCPPNQINCKDRCADPLTDNIYCGATGDCEGVNSGQTCAVLFDEQCVNGSCALVCPAGEVACNGRCIDPQTSQNHCGARLDCIGANAGRACPAPEQSCVNGLCEDTGCGESETSTRPDPVVIELVLDKSGSMVETWTSAGLTETRWKSLHRAVLKLADDYGQQNGNRGRAEFGALLFPAADASLPYNSDASRMCAAPRSNTCTSTTDAWDSSNPYRECTQADGSIADCIRPPYDVDSGLDPAWMPSAAHTSAHFNSILPHADARAMESQWNRSTFNDGNEGNRRRRIGGGTPTAQAMRAAITVLGQPIYDGRKRVAILISDGATTGTDYTNSSGQSCAQARANALESELYSVLRAAKQSQDIPTYVIGVDLRTSSRAGAPSGNCSRHNVNARSEANSMASAGGTDNAINVVDSAALNNAFETILKDVLSCTVSIGERAPYINDVQVYFPDSNNPTQKGPEIRSFWDVDGCGNIPGGQAGWVYANPGKTQIELCHGACQDFKDRLTGELHVVKGCKGPE